MSPHSLDLLALLLLGVAGCDGVSKADPCADGESMLMSDGSPTGFELCPDGAINRVEALAVDPTIPGDACVGEEEEGDCDSDDQCTEGFGGRCITRSVNLVAACVCAYTCSTDADCDAGEACLRPEMAPDGVDHAHCVPATCRTNADCDAECGLSGAFYCEGPVLLSCRTHEDVCHGSDQCDDSDACGTDAPGEAWDCRSAGCVTIGRPLLVEGTARTAPVIARSDWSSAVPVTMPPVEVRHVLAAYWAEIGAFEHASVASFARVTLQLLALGAPADLVADTQAAAADEVAHARFAFGLASAYAGNSVGPGPLPLDGAAPALDARSVLKALIHQACVGETLGAAELLASADACAEPALAGALRRMGEDEARHATLAWRTVRWIATTHALGEEAEGLLAAEVTRWRRRGPAEAPHFPEHGVLGCASRRRVHAQVLGGIVPRCVGACLAA